MSTSRSLRWPCPDRVPPAQLLRTSSSTSAAADAPDAGAAALPGNLAAKLRAGGSSTSACHTLSSHPLFQRKSAASAAAGQGAADSPCSESPQGSGSHASGESPRGTGGGGGWRFAEPVGPATGQALLHIHRGGRKEGGGAEPGSPVAPVTP